MERHFVCDFACKHDEKERKIIPGALSISSCASGPLKWEVQNHDSSRLGAAVNSIYLDTFASCRESVLPKREVMSEIAVTGFPKPCIALVGRGSMLLYLI